MNVDKDVLSYVTYIFAYTHLYVMLEVLVIKTDFWSSKLAALLHSSAFRHDYTIHKAGHRLIGQPRTLIKAAATQWFYMSS